MRILMIAAVLGLAAAAPAHAQPEHAAHAVQDTVSVKDPANPTHEECKSVMGRKMDGRVVHDHMGMKGHPGARRVKPLTKAEMDKMHGKCAAKLEAAKADEAKK